MKKILHILYVAILVIGIASTAQALQYGFGYSNVDLGSLQYNFTPAAGSNPSPTAARPGVYTQNLGYYSTGYAIADGPGEFSADSYYGRVRNDWALAYTNNSFAAAATFNGNSYAMASASAGNGHGTYSGALAGTFVSAYQFYVGASGDLTIGIDYDLRSLINGDEPGYSAAGAGAMLGVYQNGVGGSNGQWLSLAGEYGLNYDDISDTLWVTLSGLTSGSIFSIFAGTAAWAYAYAPGDNTAPVPEPATMLLLGTGLVGLASFGRKKMAKKNK